VELPRVRLAAPAVPRAWIASRVVQMREDGCTAAQIADALSISKQTVWAMLREAGHGGRGARLPPGRP
jgi:DNA invertase Pin-like site-specific DNA recombinase